MEILDHYQGSVFVCHQQSLHFTIIVIDSLLCVVLWPTGDESPDAALEDSACQEDAALASLAPDTDVGSESYHLPLVTTTWMLFLEADHVSQPYLGNHWLS
jgi:hypothetical protein